MLLLIFNISCSEKDSVEPEDFNGPTGSLWGNIILMDTNENEISDFDDVSIGIFGEDQFTSTAQVNSHKVLAALHHTPISSFQSGGLFHVSSKKVFQD